MRIALLSCDPALVYGDGNACPARLRGLARALARAGHEVAVVAPAFQEAVDDEVAGVELRALRPPVSVREIDWHLSHVRPDVVIERHYPGSLEGARAALEAGVVHAYDLDLPARLDGAQTSAAVRGALPEALAASRAAIVPGGGAAARLRAVAGAEQPVCVIAGGAGPEFLSDPAREDVDRHAAWLRLGNGRPCVGFFGELQVGCGLPVLVRALGAIAREGRPRLLVIGDGPERNAALAAAEDAGVGLVLCGRVAGLDAPAHLALCDLVVVPTEASGDTSQPLVEAMAMGRAVIAPAGEPARELAMHGHDAYLAPPDDPAALGELLSRLLADPPLRARVGAQARRTVLARHTWGARAVQLAAFARTLTEGGAEPAPVARADGRAR